jgi:hypothetical protein
MLHDSTSASEVRVSPQLRSKMTDYYYDSIQRADIFTTLALSLS